MTGPRRSHGSRRSNSRRGTGAPYHGGNKVSYYSNGATRAKPATCNPANRWVKEATIQQKKDMGGECQYPGCHERRLSELEFVHIHETEISRTGSRGRKEKLADVHAHPEAYKLECHRHHVSDPEAVEHDERMRELGAR